MSKVTTWWQADRWSDGPVPFEVIKETEKTITVRGLYNSRTDVRQKKHTGEWHRTKEGAIEAIRNRLIAKAESAARVAERSAENLATFNTKYPG